MYQNKDSKKSPINIFGSQLVSCAKTASVVALAITFLVAQCGCTRVQSRLGQRIPLANTSLASIDAKLFGNPGLVPGQESSLIVTLTESNGNLLVTEGKGKGKVSWSDLAVTADIVSVNRKGVVSLSRDPRISDGKLGHIVVTVPSHPGLRADLDIPFRYDYPFVSNFTGSSGRDGLDGMNGIDGANGFPGSFDPDHPSAGGDGSNGTNGTDGSNGEPGEDGPPVQLRVAPRAGAYPLLQIGVSAPNHRERFYLVDPQGGSLTVTSNGGAGGKGGKGGRGGRGGSGGPGLTPGRNGSDGLNGHDGFDGFAGGAGSFVVTYDPQAKPFLTAIHLSNPGGPTPVFREEPVPPLW